MKTILVALGFMALIMGCGTTQQFPAVPPDLDRTHVGTDTISVEAKRYVFIPEEIRVHHGRLIVLRITATDADHGFALPAFGIDERLEQGSPRLIEFYPPVAGQYDFKCSKFCGLGHFGMNGQIIVE